MSQLTEKSKSTQKQTMSKLSYDEIIEGNIELHRKEAKFYDCIHSEIWNRQEQKRLLRSLEFAVSQIDRNCFEAIDFGAGTGNITEKLLDLGFRVLAIDISKEMCEILEAKNKGAVCEKKLRILNVNFDKTQLTGSFDLVTCYSVLHHLPNYTRTIEKLSHLLKEGGVLYVDHEPPCTHTKQRTRPRILKRVVMFVYYRINDLLHNLYLHGIKTPQLDYIQADIHATLNCEHIKGILEREHLKPIKFDTYYSQETWLKTPLTFLHKMIVGTNVTVIVAKKQRTQSKL